MCHLELVGRSDLSLGLEFLEGVVWFDFFQGLIPIPFESTIVLTRRFFVGF